MTDSLPPGPRPLVHPRGIRRAIVSPATECGESKDQDAAFDDGDSLTACVCDGVSSSPHSAVAARELAALAPRLLEKGGDRAWVGAQVEAARARLLDLRQRASSAPLSYGNASEGARALLEEVMRSKLQWSHQTTLVAVRFTEGFVTGRLRAHAVTCGDSALMVFDGEGALVRSIPSPLAFPASTRLTQVLPDDDVLQEELELDLPCHVVLATDGFYNAFAGSEEILPWLREHETGLYGDHEGARHELLARLHGRLQETVGDDDISLVWWSLCSPTASFPDLGWAMSTPEPE